MYKDLMHNIPHAPGVYLMRNYAGELLYIGKAKDLQKRVAAHFSMKNRITNFKLQAMISNVKTVDYIILKSERDALLTENELIKKLQPKYNIIWRDDKSYPYIRITNEDFPRIYLTRIHPKCSKLKATAEGGVFGPYHNVSDLRRLLRYLRKTFGIRPCKSYKKIQSCIYYHLKQCPAPCIGKISSYEYKKSVEKVKMFLQGKYLVLKTQLEKEMKEASEKLEFEKAAKLRDIIHGIETMFEKISFREIKLEDVYAGVEISHTLTEIKQLLGLRKVPITIEAFDVSHIYGSQPCGSSVRFSYGKPDKSNYRRYKIKSVSNIDDYSMIAEIVKRRYSRLIREQQKLPDLVIIDGGKGHLSVTKNTLENLSPVLRNLEIISIAKEQELIYLVDRDEPVKLDNTSKALQLIRYIRDEAHRFALSYHKHRRKLKVKSK